MSAVAMFGDGPKGLEKKVKGTKGEGFFPQRELSFEKERRNVVIKVNRHAKFGICDL
jgi:hypothetical protein